MKLSQTCCHLHTKALSAKQRETVLANIIELEAQDNAPVAALKVIQQLSSLREEGYDIDSYYHVLSYYVMRYSRRN